MSISGIGKWDMFCEKCVTGNLTYRCGHWAAECAALFWRIEGDRLIHAREHIFNKFDVIRSDRDDINGSPVEPRLDLWVLLSQAGVIETSRFDAIVSKIFEVFSKRKISVNEVPNCLEPLLAVYYGIAILLAALLFVRNELMEV